MKRNGVRRRGFNPLCSTAFTFRAVAAALGVVLVDEAGALAEETVGARANHAAVAAATCSMNGEWVDAVYRLNDEGKTGGRG